MAQTAPAPQTPQPPASVSSTAATSGTLPQKPVPVEVTSSGNQVQVKVPDQAPLSNVLSAICRQQKIKCTGTETLTSYHGPAMTVEGSLRQVVSKLLEGTDVNYEFSRTAEGNAAEIAFLGHAPKGTAPVPSPPVEEKADRPTFLHSRPFPGRPGQPNPTPPAAPPPNAPPQSQLRPDPGASSNAVSEMSEGQGDKTNASAATALFTGSGDTTAAQYLPFPDQDGQPVPVKSSPAAALPFPDQHGNPIPLKPAKAGSPFPTEPTVQSSAGANKQ